MGTATIPGPGKLQGSEDCFPGSVLAPAMLAMRLQDPRFSHCAALPSPLSRLSLELQLPQSLRPSAQLFHSSILRLHLTPFLPKAWEFSQGRELGSERPLDASVAQGSLSLPADVLALDTIVSRLCVCFVLFCCFVGCCRQAGKSGLCYSILVRSGNMSFHFDRQCFDI